MTYPIVIAPVEMYAGDDLVIAAFTLKENTVPVDFSTWTLLCQWRKRASDTDAIALTVDTTDAATGRLVVSVSAAQTRLMGQSGVWDLQGTKGSIVRTFVRGSTTYIGDVTRNG